MGRESGTDRKPRANKGRFRGWWGDPWGFESLLRHYINNQWEFGFATCSLPRLEISIDHHQWLAYSRSRLWGQKEIPAEWCGMVFRNVEKLSRCVSRRLSFSSYAADFLPGRPIAIVLSTV
jgi:hypothetical protein